MVTKYKPKTNILTINTMKSKLILLQETIQVLPSKLAYQGLTKFMQIHQKPGIRTKIWTMEVPAAILISSMVPLKKLKIRYL